MCHLLCVEGICGNVLCHVHKHGDPGQDTHQGGAIEQGIHVVVVQPCDHLWVALPREVQKGHFLFIHLFLCNIATKMSQTFTHLPIVWLRWRWPVAGCDRVSDGQDWAGTAAAGQT